MGPGALSVAMQVAGSMGACARSPVAAQAWLIWISSASAPIARRSIRPFAIHSISLAPFFRRTGSSPKSPWAVGVRYVYADVDPHLRDEPVFPGLADRVSVKISAPTAILEYDTRDNIFTPTRGIYAETSYLASRQALGASIDFERVQQVLIGWMLLRHDTTLGARANYAWSSDETPFFLRPYIMLRGVPAVRYQGDQAASIEVEGRWQLYGRWSIVAFGGAGKAWTKSDNRSFTQGVGSGGLGFRYELASKFGLHAGIDVAHSPGTTALYFVVGNAWFRP